jgi:aspartate aminotransferase-like enzyme
MTETKREFATAAPQWDSPESAGQHGDDTNSLVFKRADQDWEFAEIAQLNYTSFVEEVPQHPGNSDGILVDRFHRDNTYFICRRGDELVGMVCVRDRRPFSLDEKLGRLESHLPQAEGASLCEVRLLAVRPGMRRTRVLPGLLTMMAHYCHNGGYDYVVMSGRVSQQQLYRHIGFIPFGPVVGDDDALYQPMYRPVGNVGAEFPGLFHQAVDRPPYEPVILTPGPVDMPQSVVRAFQQPPVSHRAPEFARMLRRVRNRLTQLTGANHASVTVGSGTLANDLATSQLKRLNLPGVIVAAGEFGQRLFDHADRMGMTYSKVLHGWGDPLDYERIEAAVAAQPGGWLWTVHCETSTGALADLPRLKAICRRYDTRLALDCISSLGAIPVDLHDVWLATAASGKGLAAYPGLALVFCSEMPTPDKTLPRYLDLGLYCATGEAGSVPFTLSSNLLAALSAGLDRQSDELLARIDADGRWVRQQLRSMGLQLVASESESIGAVTTIALPPDEIDADELGRSLEAFGFFTSYASGYLRERNWLQICLMGEVRREQLERLIPVLTARIEVVRKRALTV